MPKVFVYNNPRRRIPKSVIYSTCAILLVTLIVVIVVLVVKSQNKSKYESKQFNDAISLAARSQDENASASSSNEALTQLLAASSYAKTNQQKELLYHDIALSYESNGNPQRAIHYIKLQLQVDPSASNADALFEAQVYQQLGDDSQAISEYRLAINNVNSNSKMSKGQKQSVIENYNGIIQSLESAQ